jgi:hypothetical protein
VSSGIDGRWRGLYRRFHVLKLSLATVAVVAVAGIAAVAAPASDTPVVGSTTTTTCTFDHGATQCREQTITVSAAENCFDVGLRLYETAEVDSARTYRGDAVLPGLDGETVEGQYADVVRPHSRLIYDSEGHGFSVTVPVEDPTCTG